MVMMTAIIQARGLIGDDGLFWLPSSSGPSSSFLHSAASLLDAAAVRASNHGEEQAGQRACPHQATDQRSILVLHLSNTMETPTLPHRLTRLPLTKDIMGRVTTVAQIKVISVDSNKAWSCSSRRTRTPGVERTFIRHQLVRRQERRWVMVSSDDHDGHGEVGGKSGFIDSFWGHMAPWSIECLI